jgi:hypothetical protein
MENRKENRKFKFNPHTGEFIIKKETQTEDYTATSEDIYNRQGVKKLHKDSLEFLKGQEENLKVLKQKYEKDIELYERQIEFFSSLINEIEKNYNVKDSDEDKEKPTEEELKEESTA